MADNEHPASPPLEALERRVHELEAEVARLQEDNRFFRSVLDELPQSLYRKDVDGRCTYANRPLLETLGRTLPEALGTTVYDFYPRELAEKYDADERGVVATGDQLETVEEHRVPTTGEALFVRVIKSPVRDANGQIVGTQGIYWDVTHEVRATQLAAEVAQKDAELREIGTPLLPIAEGVLAMPLIGDIDHARAERVLDTLLRGVTEQQASMAILDVTGVTTFDAEVADTLLQVARAVRLLGADVMITGMKPAMAQAVVTMDVAFEGIQTFGTLKSGVAHALRKRRAMR